MTPDEQLRIDLIDELNDIPSLRGHEIEVDVRMGMVRMTGSVESIEERRAADGAAARIVGASRVAGSVSVRRARAAVDADWVQEVRSSLEP